jgi:hypothetical protein
VDLLRNDTRLPLIHPGQVLAAGPDGPKLLVLAGGDGPCVITHQGRVLGPGRPEPCSQPPPRAATDTPLQRGDLLEDSQSGLVVRCLRGGYGEVHCNGRRLVRYSRLCIHFGLQ